MARHRQQLPASELTAAFLLAQLERVSQINADRMRTWNSYHAHLEQDEKDGLLVRPATPAADVAQHNAHIYYVLLSSPSDVSAVRA